MSAGRRACRGQAPPWIAGWSVGYAEGMRRTRALPVLALLLLGPGPLLVAPRTLRAERNADEKKGSWKDEPAYKALLASEAKAFATLMRLAVKEDFRRQAWFLADRVLAAKPGDAEAEKVLETWSDAQLMEGRAPTPEFEGKRDKTLVEAGDGLARFAELLNGAGVEPEEYYELNVRAFGYGSRYSALVAAFQEAGYAALHTFHDAEIKQLEEVLGERWKAVTFPPAWDDGYLKVRVRWPEARIAQLGPFRLLTDLKVGEALRVLGVLEGARAHVVEALEGAEPAAAPPLDVVLFTEAETYARLAPRLVPERDAKEALEGSSWYDRQGERVVACWRHRVNAWIGEDAVVAAAVAPFVARRWFGQNASGWVSGRGAWLLDGLGGAMQGLAVDPKTGAAELDPERCWRLAAARSLREEGVLLSWEKFLEVDREKARAWPRRDAKVAFRGGSFQAQDVDVAACQATAFVVGLMKADKGKGAKKLGALLRDLLKRDALPDLDKTLGWKKHRWMAEAEKAIDAATGR